LIAILGAGISGISAGYHLGLEKQEYIVFEKRNSWGGLCDNFILEEEYRFDYFVHLSFAKDEYVRNLFSESADFYKHTPLSTNYYKGRWLKHPVQNNLSKLNIDDKVKIISDFIERPKFDYFTSYKEWLFSQFGSYFATNFPERYTRKYWTIPAEEMTVDWLSNRFSLPPLDKLLRGAFEEQEENFYYAKEMLYPTQGGYKSFLKGMASKTYIETNKEVVLIDLKTKRIDFADNSFIHYEDLISSIPLPEFIKRIKDVPRNILEASEKLLCTSGQLVSLGFNRPDIPRNIWFYIYDEDILPARVYSPSIKSPDNVPDGKSSLQFETYFSKNKPAKLKSGSLIEHIVEKGIRMGLFSLNDIEITDYREVTYANVVFDFERKSNLSIVHNYLDEIGISYIGRFGEWDYLWSDQSLLSGKKKAEDISDQINK
jgi:protoporphyrinogen oxidase